MKQRRMETYQGAFLSIALCCGCLGAVSPIGSKLGHDVWLLMVPAGLAGLMLFFFYSALLRRCNGRDLAQLNLAAFGPRSGRVVLVIYLSYFLFVTCYFLLAAIDLWMIMGMRRTPFIVYVALILLFCVLTARMGLAALGRAAGFFVAYYLLMTLIDTLLLWPEMSWQRLLPLRVSDWPRFAEDSLYIMALMFALLPQALIFLPRLKEGGKTKKCLAIGIVVIFGELLLANLRNVFLFGDALQFEDYPTYQALRLVEWGSGILRLELFGVLAGLSLLFLFGALSFYGMGNLMSAISGRNGSRLLIPLAVIAGALMCGLKSAINFVDNTVVLVTITVGAAVMLVLLFIAVVTLQKTDCKRNNDKV